MWPGARRIDDARKRSVHTRPINQLRADTQKRCVLCFLEWLRRAGHGGRYGFLPLFRCVSAFGVMNVIERFADRRNSISILHQNASSIAASMAVTKQRIPWNFRSSRTQQNLTLTLNSGSLLPCLFQAGIMTHLRQIIVRKAENFVWNISHSINNSPKRKVPHWGWLDGSGAFRRNQNEQFEWIEDERAKKDDYDGDDCDDDKKPMKWLSENRTAQKKPQ